MKKIVFNTLLGVMGLMAVSCDEDFNKDVADPQSWPQEEAITLPSFTVTAASTVDLASAADSVTLFSYSISSTDMPEGATLDHFRIELLPETEGASATTLNASSEGKVATAELQSLIENNYGKRPVERKFDATVYADIITDGQASLIKSDIDVTAIPKAPYISNAYYLVGDMVGWDASSMVQFVHSDKDVYEDPVFTLMFTTTKDNMYWKIIPQENVDGEFWGDPGVVGVAVDGDSSLSGSLINSGANAGKIEKAGMYSMTLNMMDYTYTLKAIAPEYYIVGAMQGWNSDATKGKTCMLYPETAMIHSYTTAFEGDANLKLWLGSDFGDWNACYGAATDGDNSASGSLVSSNAGAIVCPEKGAFYTFKVDFSTMTYTWTKLDNQSPKEYAQISLIGGFNGWGDDADLTEVTPHNWYISGLTLPDGSLKLRANHDWSISWGGLTSGIDISDQSYGPLTTSDGKDLYVPAGTYTIYFNDITWEYAFIKAE